MVDIGIVQRILQSLNDALEHLKTKQTINFITYQQDKDIQAIVERRLETAIQGCIDIGNHIIAQENLGRPEDYGQIFSILAEHKIITPDMAIQLKKMAGFRNVLIHEYRDIIVEKVYQVLQDQLNDFYTYAHAIMRYLKL